MAPGARISGRRRPALSVLVGVILVCPSATGWSQEEPPLTIAFDAIAPWIDDDQPFELTLRLRNRTPDPLQGLDVEVRFLASVTSRSVLRAAVEGDSRTTVASLAERGLNVGQSRTVRFEATRAELGSLRLGIYPVAVRATGPGGIAVEVRTAIPVISNAPQTRLNVLSSLDVVDPDPPVRLGGGYDPDTLAVDRWRVRSERLRALGTLPALITIDGATVDAIADIAGGTLTRAPDGTLDDLAPSDPRALAAGEFVAALRQVGEHGAFTRQPYTSIDLGALAASRAATRIQRQFRRGAGAIRESTGHPSDQVATRVALPDRSHYPPAIDTFVVDAAQVDRIDGAPFSPELFGSSTPLSIDDRRLLVADARLSELAESETAWIPAAQAIVAETALRWLELPLVAEERLIVFAPRPEVSPRLLEHVATTFSRAPWLRNVLREDVGEARGQAVSIPPRDTIETLSLAIPAASRSLRSIRSLLPEEAGDVAFARIREWETALMIAERTTTSGVGDPELADAVREDIDAHLGRVRAPAGRRITLTSRTGAIPIVVENGNDFPVDVVVHLGGTRLRFPGGDTVPVRIPSGGTTLDVDVEVLGQGSFPLDVSIATPTGTVLGSEVVLLRSTQVSRVAFLVVAGALAFLFLQATRRRRRARREPPAPSVPSSA